VTDEYYGTKVVDRYRYMENLKDPEVQGWMRGQNDYTRAVLKKIPGRQRLLARIHEIFESAPAQVSYVRALPGDLYFYEKILAKESIPKLYVRSGLQGTEKLLVDPEKIALAAPKQAKGKNNIQYFAPSGDCKYVAVGIAPGRV
jgi:prolyl oligopeptidase